MKRNHPLIYIILVLMGINYDLQSQSYYIQKFKEPIKNVGLDYDLVYTGEVFSNISGGKRQKSVYLHNVSFSSEFNLKTILGWKGARLNTHIIVNNGGIPSDYSCALQGISNIAAPNAIKVYQFWLEQNLFDNNLSFLFGLFDLNSEFDSRSTSSLFLNPSHGIGPEYSLTGENGPSIFPTTSLAFRIALKITNLIGFRFAVFDGIPGNPDNPHGTSIILNKEDGLLFTSEFSISKGTEDRLFKLLVGGWYYNTTFKRIQSPKISNSQLSQKGNYGFYTSLEKCLYLKNQGSDSGLYSFLRIGISDPNVNIVDGYLGGGIQYKGLFDSREKDKVGIALAASHNSYAFQKTMKHSDYHSSSTKFEYIIELTYEMYMYEHLLIQPDIQFVINPAGGKTPGHALVLGTRIMLIL